VSCWVSTPCHKPRTSSMHITFVAYVAFRSRLVQLQQHNVHTSNTARACFLNLHVIHTGCEFTIGTVDTMFSRLGLASTMPLWSVVCRGICAPYIYNIIVKEFRGFIWSHDRSIRYRESLSENSHTFFMNYIMRLLFLKSDVS
jgi:hypothetical protein